MLVRASIILLLFSMLAACGGRDKPVQRSETIADLQPVILTENVNATDEQISLQELIANYRAVLEVSRDPETVKKVTQRLAHLEILLSENMQTETETAEDVARTNASYQRVVDEYERLLDQYPDDPENDGILYQLSKAYDALGQRNRSLFVLNRLVKEFPKSTHIVEAQFRRGEIFFTDKRWRLAQEAYEQVLTLGKGSSFYLTAKYMHGWVLFKRNDYEYALRDFASVLDMTMPPSGLVEELDKTQKPLVEDSFRIMSLLFAYLEGYESIAQLLDEVGERPYAVHLYQGLGELFISQQRYRDSAETYKGFIERYPGHQRAPLFQLRVIDAYTKGRFPSLLLPEKELFVRQYGVRSQYWAGLTDFTRERMYPHLKQHIDELSAVYHAKAQNMKKRYKGGGSRKQREQLVAAYGDAAYWYAEFIATFPLDEKLPEKVFLYAESLFEAGQYRLAIEQYSRVAYEFSDDPNASEAGYAVVWSYRRLLDQLRARPVNGDNLKQEEINTLLNQKIASALRFSKTFPADRRALPVQLKASEELFGLQLYLQALQAATGVIQWQPATATATPVATAKQQLTAWLVIGHSQFELQDYAAAESAYQSVIGLLAQKDQRRPAIRERIAASIYKQAEALVASGSLTAAVDMFIRVGDTIPETEIRVNADYDAAAYLLQLKDWPRAVTVLNDFRTRYPKHAFTADIPAKLALAYQELGQWQKAAAELKYIWKHDEDPIAQRQALYLAAELYEKAGQTDLAIDAYRSYAHQYRDPFDMMLEAQYKLSEFYRQQNQDYKRRFWLKKIIKADAAAGDKRTARSLYLAAMASNVFAEDKRWVFKKIKLKAPLQKNLKKKQKALKEALEQYDKVIAYGTEEFTTQATFRIAEIYAQLANDLMDSERPSNLSALEMEQYDILLEEQAYPFEENAIEIHEANSQRSWTGSYDKWVKESFSALRKLLPGRYNKSEQKVVISEGIY